MFTPQESHAFMTRSVKNAVVLCTIAALPLGLSFAQDADDLDKVRSWLEQGVNSAFLTQEQADIMLNALEGNPIAGVRAFSLQDGAPAPNLPTPFERDAFAAIVQQFAAGRITEQQAKDQALALGLLPEGATVEFHQDIGVDADAPRQFASIRIVRDADVADADTKQIRIFTTVVEPEDSD